MNQKFNFYKLNEDNQLIPFDDYDSVKHRQTPKYLNKKDFDLYHIELCYSRDDFRKQGIGSKSFIKTYHYHYPDRAERKKILGSKISLSQKRKNSNSVNTGKLKKLIDKDALEQDIKDGNQYIYLCKKYRVSEPTLLANLIHHNLYDKYRDVFLARKFDLNVLESIERMLSTSILDELLNPDVCIDDIIDFTSTAERHLRKCKEVIQYIRRYYKLGASLSPNSKLERFAMEVLDNYHLDYIPQFKVDSYYFDLYVPKYSLLIECDGYYHTPERDALKDAIAVKNSLKVVRIVFDKSIYNKKIKCLQKIQYELSDWLI